MYLAGTTTCVVGVGLTTAVDKKFSLPLVESEHKGAFANYTKCVTTPSRRKHLPYLGEIFIVHIPVTSERIAREGEPAWPQMELWCEDHDLGLL